MRRPLIRRLALAVILGVVTTVGMAWLFAVVRSIPGSTRLTCRTFMLYDRAWSAAECRMLGVVDISWMELTNSPSGPSPKNVAIRLAAVRYVLSEVSSESDFAALESPPSWGSLSPSLTGADLPPAGGHGTDTAFGFPLPCLWHREVSPFKSSGSFAGSTVFSKLWGGTTQSRGPNGFTTLPFRPLWPAFILTTVVFTAAWLLVLTAIGAARARRRIRRNLCPRCAYDLSATSLGLPCPECGTVRAQGEHVPK